GALPELGGDKTAVTEPSFIQPPLAEQSTQIFPENAVTVPVPKLAGETWGRPASPDLPTQPTVILEVGTPATVMPTPGYDAANGTNGALHAAALADGAGMRIPTGVRPPTGRVVSPPPYTHTHVVPGRSTLWKDVAIGIAVAVFVVASVLGARALLTR